MRAFSYNVKSSVSSASSRGNRHIKISSRLNICLGRRQVWELQPDTAAPWTHSISMEWTQQLHQNPHKQFSICTHVVPAQPQNKQTVIRFQCLNNPCFLHTPILPYFLLQIGARATQDFLDRLTCCSIVSDLTAFLTEDTALLVFSPITRSVSSEY